MRTRTWFITGTGSGFGHELTTLLLARGDRVAATTLRPGALADLSDQYGEQLWTATLDVTDTSAIRRTVAGAFNHFERIDVVVSNAGYGLFGAAEEASDEQLLHQIGTNLIGSIQLARAVIPHFRNQGGGRIMQMASSGGQVADPGMSLYNATKWGIEGFFEAASMELSPLGIEVTIIEPGGSRTGFTRSMAFAEPIDDYRHGIVGQIRHRLTGDADPDVVRPAVTGDPAKVAQAIIDSADVSPAPRRLTLGGNAYEQIRESLRSRLASLEAQRELAYSTDADDIDLPARSGTKWTATTAGFQHVSLSVANLDIEQRWWEQALGLREVERFELPEPRVRTVVLRGPNGLGVELIERPGSSPQTFDDPLAAALTQGYGHWAIEVDDLDQAFAELSASPAQAVWPPAPAVQPGGRFAYVRDPEGNLLELIQPPMAGTQLLSES